MNPFAKYMALFAALVLSVSCVGKKEEVVEQNSLVLASDKEVANVVLDESFYFSVLHNGTDVTYDAVIYDVTAEEPVAVDDVSFTPAEPGKYNFIALYDKQLSDTLTVEAVAVEIVEERDFLRRSLIMDFTATWCVNCPNMAAAVEAVEDEYKGRIIDIAVHWLDDYASAAGDKIVSDYGITAIPVAVVDMDETSMTSVASATLLGSAVKKGMDIFSPAAGIRIDSREEDGSLAVDVECTLVSEGDYRLAVALVRDGVIASQTGGSKDYVHNSILLDCLGGDYRGESLGSCAQDEVVTRSYSYDLAKIKDIKHTRIVAYLLSSLEDGRYVVNNVTACKAGGSVGYSYEQIQ